MDADVSVRDRFLTAQQVSSLAECARVRRERGDFSAARIGADRKAQHQPSIRGDSTCWLAEPSFPAERGLLERLEQLRLELNREALLGLFELELHYAWYPPGAGYARHVDQLQGRDRRKVSLILYLNESWGPDDGGELRLFDADGRHRDIEPLGGRLVVFPTAGREHSVLPTRHGRSSISGWFCSRP